MIIESPKDEDWSSSLSGGGNLCTYTFEMLDMRTDRCQELLILKIAYRNTASFDALYGGQRIPQNSGVVKILHAKTTKLIKREQKIFCGVDLSLNEYVGAAGSGGSALLENVRNNLAEAVTNSTFDDLKICRQDENFIKKSTHLLCSLLGGKEPPWVLLSFCLAERPEGPPTHMSFFKIFGLRKSMNS